jgi:glycerate dehydrogenase
MDPENPLLKIQDSRKLIITPHIAWAAKETRFRAVDEVIKNIESFLCGEDRNRVY